MLPGSASAAQRALRLRPSNSGAVLPHCCPMWHPVCMTYHGYLGFQARGVIALPAEVRRRLHLDDPGAQVEVTEREDGVLGLRPSLPVPADQRGFWTKRWQRREREVDEHVSAERVVAHDDGVALLSRLAGLEANGRP